VREGAACEAARHASWAERGHSAGCGQMHRSAGRKVPGISATAPVTIGEGSITGGWGGDFEIDYWSLVPAGDLFGSCVSLVRFAVARGKHVMSVTVTGASYRGGAPLTQRWAIRCASSCSMCHTSIVLHSQVVVGAPS
jgi:hypothetical protein